MEPSSNAATIDPSLLQQGNLPKQLDIAYSTYSTGLESTNWEPANNLDRFVSCVLEAQIKIHDLPQDVAQRLSSEIEGIWRATDARIAQFLASNEMIEVDCCDSDERPACSIFPEQADSDVEEEDNHLFPALYEKLREFADAKTRSFLVIQALASTQRRHVHAIAHFMHFGHLSIGAGTLRMILLSRRQSSITLAFKARYKAFRSFLIKREHYHYDNPRPSPPYLSPADGRSRMSFGNSLNINTMDTVDHSSADSSASASSHFSAGSGFSNISGPFRRTRGKRKRQPAAFECTFPGCAEKFDRWCDLNHHSRVHLPYEQRPYPCE